MFRSTVSYTPAFNYEMLDAVLMNKSSIHDNTLMMTLIALLYNRVKNLKINYVESSDNILLASEINPRPDVFTYIIVETDNDPEEVLAEIKSKFTEIKKLEVHEKFLSKELNQTIHVRTMPNENTVCVIAHKFNLETWHLTQSFIPVYYKIFRESPLTDKELQFIQTLSSRDPNKYRDKLAVITSSESFQNFSLVYMLEGFEKKAYKRKIEAARKELDEIEQKMTSLLESYQRACNSRITAMAYLLGLENMSENSEEKTELHEYLVNNKNICNLNISESKISFIVKTYLAPYLFDDWENMRRNGAVFKVNACGAASDPKDAELLMNAIFSEDHTLKLKMCAYFIMDYFGSSVHSMRNYAYKDNNPALVDYIPNPHLDIHDCLGQNAAEILTNLKNGDLLGAIECSINVAKRVNVSESVTFNPFVQKLFTSNSKCIVTEDGKELTVKEAIKYLKGEMNE